MHLLAAATVTVLLLPAQVQSVALTDEVPGRSGLCYGDLMKQAIPDLAPRDDGTWAGQQIPELHDIQGNPHQNDLSGGFAFATVDVLKVREDGKSRLLLLTQGGPTDSFAELLAVFDDQEPAPKLLDIADAGSDKLVGFRIPPVVSIADRTDLFLIENEHSNSDQSYVDTAMLFPHGGKLKFAAGAFTSGERLCRPDARARQAGEGERGKVLTQSPSSPVERCEGRGPRWYKATVSAEYSAKHTKPRLFGDLGPFPRTECDVRGE